MGAHYTPPALARLLADKIIEYMGPPVAGRVRVLDPACGDGKLLQAAMEALRRRGVEGSRVVGVEADASALAEARKTLTGHGDDVVELIAGDFLHLAVGFQPQRDLWPDPAPEGGLHGDFDVVIANPPYVRTQVLGAARAQQLARQFELSGRIDLSHVFIQAMTLALRAGGILGIITSNRFMSTLAGKAIRAFVSTNIELLELIDLGDTKLFEAAVLPAVLLGRRRDHRPSSSRCVVPFARVYSQLRTAPDKVSLMPRSGTVVEALAAGDEGIIRVSDGTYDITRGFLSITPGSDDVWALLSPRESDLVARLQEKSCGTIGDVAHVRVGIKTTADDVFIRKDWASLPTEKRPESELLRPLLSHEDACRWAMQRQHRPLGQVLYPHFVSGGAKRVADLKCYPRTLAYLEDFRSRLEARRYVVEAGRKWYEVWVPQDPGAWQSPKLVFPDISPEPRFFLVEEDYVVNGNCYWLMLRPEASEDLLYLILAVANSTLMTRFHDAAFGNKLYAGRRRYITQYVAKYPLPDDHTKVARHIVLLARKVVTLARTGNTEQAGQIEQAIDALVHEAYGFDLNGEPQ